jgi:hypothetical protein
MKIIEIRKQNNQITVQNEYHTSPVVSYDTSLYPDISVEYIYLQWSDAAWYEKYYVDLNNHIQAFTDEQLIFLENLSINIPVTTTTMMSKDQADYALVILGLKNLADDKVKGFGTKKLKIAWFSPTAQYTRDCKEVEEIITLLGVTNEEADGIFELGASLEIDNLQGSTTAEQFNLIQQSDSLLDWKDSRALAVNNIEVTHNSIVYQGDEESQTRMARAILALPDDSATIPWTAKDNSVIQLTKIDLLSILTDAGSKQSLLWNTNRPN